MITSISILIILVPAAIAAVVILLIFAGSGRFAKNNPRAFDPFRLQNGCLIVNTLSNKPVYPLTRIARVRFFCRHRRGGWTGQFQIVQSDGKKSRRFVFDGSVYTRRFQPYSTREDILNAVEQMRAELLAYGIPCDGPIYLEGSNG